MPTNPTGSILVRRGPTVDRLAFCPLSGEVIYDTDLERFYIGDGVTYGGVGINQRDFPNKGVMIKGTTTDNFLVAAGDAFGSDYQFLIYSKATGLYEFSTISASGVAITSLQLSGNNGLTLTRTDISPPVSNPTITTVGRVTVDVDPVPFKTAISLQNVTNESKTTMFTSPTFTGHATLEGQTLTGVTGTGNLVLATSPTLTTPTVSVVNGSTSASGTLTLRSTTSATKATAGVLIDETIASTSKTTGALVVTGGVGISGNSFIGGNLQVDGNITYGGGVNQLSATQLNVDDPMIYLAYNNVADIIDTGILVAYNDGVHKHAGLARDHTDKTWKFFTELVTEPAATVSWGDVTYANVRMAALTATSLTGTLNNTLTINGTAYNNSSAVSVTIPKGDTGSTGPAGPSTYDLFNFVNGKPLALEVLMRAVTVRIYTIAANFSGCLAYCTTGPTSAQTINILKNGAAIGTIKFAIASTSGVFAGSPSGITMNVGDQLQVQMASGASQDASFSDLTFTIKGTSA